jgi:hypothetical protein
MDADAAILHHGDPSGEEKECCTRNERDKLAEKPGKITWQDQ